MTFAIAYKFVPLNLPGPVRACLCEQVIESEHRKETGLSKIVRPADGWCKVGQTWEIDNRKGATILPGVSFSRWREDVLGCNRPAEIRQYGELILQVLGFYMMLWLAARRYLATSRLVMP